MAMPMIGVMPLYDPELNNQWMLDGYLQAIEAAGGLPVVLSFSASHQAVDQYLDTVDGLLFPGGQDIVPLHYGHRPVPACGVHVPELDLLELYTLEQARRRELPVFGVCRGLQLINVALGGTLYQDIPAQLVTKSPVLHNQGGCTALGHPYHTVAVEKNSRLYACLGVETLPVNTLHRQGIRDLAPGLKAAAHAPDGLVECVEAEAGGFLMAVQWHPELSFRRDPHALALFQLFVRHCQ